MEMDFRPHRSKARGPKRFAKKYIVSPDGFEVEITCYKCQRCKIRSTCRDFVGKRNGHVCRPRAKKVRHV